VNTTQRLVLVAVGVVALAMFLFPPFYLRYANGVVANLGYHFLFDPPTERGLRAAGLVHAPTLLVQFLGLLVVGGVAWLLGGALPARKERPAERRSNGPTFGGQPFKSDASRAKIDAGDRTGAKTAIKGPGGPMRAVLEVGGIAILAGLILTAFDGAMVGEYRWQSDKLLVYSVSMGVILFLVPYAVLVAVAFLCRPFTKNKWSAFGTHRFARVTSTVIVAVLLWSGYIATGQRANVSDAAPNLLEHWSGKFA
jgi:hypothetical protein